MKNQESITYNDLASNCDPFQLRIDGTMYSGQVMRYLTASTEKEQAHVLAAIQPGEYDGQYFRLSWQAIPGAQEYRILFSEQENLSEPFVFTTAAAELLPGILIPGKQYAAKVYALDGRKQQIAESSVIRFSTETGVPVRLLHIGGMFNVRDLGGWNAGGNKIVRYGMLYRGGSTAWVSESGKETLLYRLKIKTELDVRTNGTKDAEIHGLPYIRCGIWQYSMILPGFVSQPAADDASFVRCFDPGSPDGVRAIFELLAQENRYPIYLHCGLGADRTGTICYLINGMLGVSYEDLVKDYELTNFSAYGNRIRSRLLPDGFDPSGIMLNTTGNLIAFGQLHAQMLAEYGEEGRPLRDTIETYLRKACGISRDTIEQVRRLLLV